MAKKLLEGRKDGSGHGTGSRVTQFRNGNQARTAAARKASGKASPNSTAVNSNNTAETFAQVFIEEFNAKIPITENGRNHKISKYRALIKQLANMSATGDIKAIKPAMQELKALIRLQQAAKAPTEEIDDDEQEVLQGIIERIRATSGEPK